MRNSVINSWFYFFLPWTLCGPHMNAICTIFVPVSRGRGGFFSAFNRHKNLSKSDIIFRKQPRLHKNQLNPGLCFVFRAASSFGKLLSQKLLSKDIYPLPHSSRGSYTHRNRQTEMNAPLCFIVTDFWGIPYKSATFYSSCSIYCLLNVQTEVKMHQADVINGLIWKPIISKCRKLLQSLNT